MDSFLPSPRIFDQYLVYFRMLIYKIIRRKKNTASNIMEWPYLYDVYLCETSAFQLKWLNAWDEDLK